MFITVRYGNNQHQIFNPECAVIHLMANIKQRCHVGFNQDVDLTDETGLLIGISEYSSSHDVATHYLAPQNTFILVEKREVLRSQALDEQPENKEGKNKNNHPHLVAKNKKKKLKKRGPKFYYFPLLVEVTKYYPDYFVHATIEEKRHHKKNKADSMQDPNKEMQTTRNSIQSPVRARKNLVRKITNYNSRRATLV